MNQGLMFYPVLAVIILTVFVLYLMFRGRTNAVRAGAVTAAYFKTYDTGEKLPRAARQAERCYHNLLESTPPFYVICIAAIALASVDLVFLALAWTYVLFRTLQTVVHLTHNKLGMRSRLYMLSWIVLLAFAIRLAYLVA